MNNFDILFIVITIIFTAVCYIATNNILCTVIVFALSGLYFFLLARKRIKRYVDVSHRFHSCFTFVNSFLISLSVKGSILAAFDYVKLNMDKEYLNIVDGLSTLKEDERLDYLRKYFNFDIYNLFLSVVNIYIEQGGDILSLSTYLVNEVRRNEDYLIRCETFSKHKVVDFAVLWFFTLFILVILRFSLNQFYSLISNLLFYQIAIVALFMVLLLSIHLLIYRITKIEIKGFNNAQ